MTRFVRTYHNDRDDPGSRLIIDYDPDGTGEFSFADQTVLPEKVREPDCRRVTVVGSIELDRDAAQWARDAFIDLCKQLDAEEQELPPAQPPAGIVVDPVQAAAELETRAIVAAAHGVPLSAVQVVRAEPELSTADRCPHGNMPREAGYGHWRDWHRGHGCHLDPDVSSKKGTP